MLRFIIVNDQSNSLRSKSVCTATIDDDCQRRWRRQWWLRWKCVWIICPSRCLSLRMKLSRNEVYRQCARERERWTEVEKERRTGAKTSFICIWTTHILNKSERVSTWLWCCCCFWFCFVWFWCFFLWKKKRKHSFNSELLMIFASFNEWRLRSLIVFTFYSSCCCSCSCVIFSLSISTSTFYCFLYDCSIDLLDQNEH